MKKRLLASILALCMIITMTPTVAFAAGDDESSPQANTTYEWKDYGGYYDAATEGEVSYISEPTEIGTLYDEIYAAESETDKIAVINKALSGELITENLANRLKEVVHVYTTEELRKGVSFQKNGNTNLSDFIATVNDGEMLISGEGELKAYNKYNNKFFAPSNASIALRPWNTERAGQKLSSVRFGNGITEIGEYAFFNQSRNDITSATFDTNLKILLMCDKEVVEV